MERASFCGDHSFFLIWSLISFFLFVPQLIGLIHILGTPEILVSTEHLFALSGFGTLLELIKPTDKQLSKTKPHVVSALLGLFLATLLMLAGLVSLNHGRIPHFLLPLIASVPLIVLNVRKLM